jgi:urea transport system permease protein
MPLCRQLVLTLLLGLGLLIGAVQNGQAKDFKAAITSFANDSFGDTEKAIATVATSGSAQAAAVVDALQDSRLLFSTEPKAVFYKDAKGKFFDAATGAPVASPPADLKVVRLNNRLRRNVDAALGGLTLVSPDPAKRLEGAIAVYKSRDAAALPALDTAIAKEPEGRIKTALIAARAAVIAMKRDASDVERMAAIDIVEARGDQDAAGLLSAVAANSDGMVKNAALTAAAGVQSRLALWANAQNVWYGLSLGSVLLLAAIGLAITFGVMGVINMAHGEMVMLGAYTTYAVQEYIRAAHPSWFDNSLFIAIPLAFVITGAMGIAIERSIIRFLYGRPLETLLATWGLSLILQQLVRTIFGANNKEVGAPSFMSGTFEVGSLQVTYGRMWIIVFAIVVFASLQLVLRATSFGLKMRAVTQNRRMASAMGIDTNRIDALAFGLGSGIAGIAGVALSQIDNVSPNLGQSYIIDSFMVVVFGGVGNLWGTLVAALTLGVANKFMEPIAGAVLAKIILLVFIILFIQKRPRGLFAQKGRAVEA